MSERDQVETVERPGNARSLEDDLGRRLRAHREDRGLSQRELARRLELSPSAISQFETGKSRVSVATLWAIVSELDVSLDELFSGLNGGGEETAGARAMASATGMERAAEERHVQRAAARKSIELETGVTWERLTAGADPRADFIYLVYEPGGSSARDEKAIVHAGREYGLVLSGTLEVTVGFDSYTLGAGDSISFDSTVPHRLRNPGTEPSHAVWFMTRPAEHHASDGAER